MANIIRIKRRAAGGGAGAPSTLENAELAYNEASDILYYGKGTGGAGGSATSMEAIGGAGAVVLLAGTQTITGNKTFSGTNSLGAATSASTQLTADNSTLVATTAFVKAQGYLTTNASITLSGDVTGTGTTAITTTIAAAAVTLAKMANLAANSFIGNNTGSAQVPLALTVAQAKTLLAIVPGDVTGFDTQVRTNRLDQMTAPTASVSMNSQKITNLLDPVSAQDAATKNYVDSIATGLDVKASVRVATATTLPAYTRSTNVITGSANGALAAVDGVTLVLNDRLLLKDGAAGSDNGIYYVSQVGTGGTPYTLTRATDADASAEVTGGMFTFVEEGTTNANSGWILTTANAINLNTTSLAFAQFSGAGQITAGAGLTKTGNTIDVIGTAARILVNANSIDIDSAYVGQTSITTLGTIGTGTWQGGVVAGLYGGTGVANSGKTITLGGNLTTSGAFATTVTVSATTTVTLPTSGTLVGSADTGTVTNTMLAGSIANAKLSNSSVTIGSTSVSLGATAATVAGLTLTAPTITGGTASALTSFGLRSTGAAFDLLLAATEVLTANKTLTFIVGDTNRTLTMTGNASITGTNTGDQTITLTGNVTGSGTGSFATTIAAGVVTNAMLAGSIDLTAKVTGILPSTNGGTGNGFTKFSGPTTSEKTFTLPNASATVLTDNAAVTVAQGGTGLAVYVIGDLLQASATTTLAKLAAVATGNVLISGGVGTVSAWGKVALTTHVSGILPVANGGTGIAYFTAAGPTTARTYTFPDANATMLSDAMSIDGGTF